MRFNGPCKTFNLLMIVNLLAIAINSSAADGQDYYLHHFKERIALELNPTKIALFGSDSSNQLVPVVASQGITLSGVEAHPISGWQILSVDQKATDNQTVEANLNSIIQQIGPEFAAPVFVDSLGGPFIPTQDILLQFKQGVSRDRQQEILTEMNLGIILDVDWANLPGAYRIRSNSNNGFTVLEQANTLAILDEILCAEPDMIFTGRGDFEPNDEFFNVCWGLHNVGQFISCNGDSGVFDVDMDAAEAWDITIGDEDIMVLILETGVQQDHPDLNQVPGADFTGGNGDGSPTNPCENHGTAVAGCVSSSINNGIGTVGVAPGCRIASARVFVGVNDAECNGSWNAQFSWGADALAWAESIGVRVTNNSNSYGGSSALLESKYAQTRDDGMVHFASAGNSADANVHYPAQLDSVNAVAAMAFLGDLASFSTYGNGIAFSAPGGGIATTDRVGSDAYNSTDYVCISGTSFASPYTAGVAALVLSVDPSLNAIEVEQILQQSCVDLGDSGYDTMFGWGMINALQAVELAGQPTCASGFSIGDANNDGAVDLLDIGPFVDAIVSGVYQCESDTNQDAAVDLLDVGSFVDLVVSE